MNLNINSEQQIQKSQAAFSQGGLAFFAFQTAARQRCHLMNKSLIAPTIKRTVYLNALIKTLSQRQLRSFSSKTSSKESCID
ncbi:hypothetical protein [Vibrio harveyi]|uniref:hypothetical protein n=1 Tax=Vibrio harveyi TaxID=669 RepID=UPI003BB48ADF